MLKSTIIGIAMLFTTAYCDIVCYPLPSGGTRCTTQCSPGY